MTRLIRTEDWAKGQRDTKGPPGEDRRSTSTGSRLAKGGEASTGPSPAVCRAEGRRRPPWTDDVHIQPQHPRPDGGLEPGSVAHLPGMSMSQRCEGDPRPGVGSLGRWAPVHRLGYARPAEALPAVPGARSELTAPSLSVALLATPALSALGRE